MAYTITVTNTGQIAYTDNAPASFTDDLSAVLDDATYNDDLASSTGAGASYSAPNLGWSGALGSGESVTITYSVTPHKAGQIRNVVVTPDGSGANCASVSVRPHGTPGNRWVASEGFEPPKS